MGKIDELIDLHEYMKTSYFMNDNEKNRRLLHYYPWLEPMDWYGHRVSITEMVDSGEILTAWNDMPLGWRKAFGWEMLRELAAVINEDKLEQFTILQIKEKFGSLRFYASGGNEKTHEIIAKYEELSYKICVECGKPAKWISKGWICPYCDECRQKIVEEETPKFVSIEEFYKEKADQD